MSESKHIHHGPNSLVWGARPCEAKADRYRITPDLVSYEELLCQLARNFDDLNERLENMRNSVGDVSYEERDTGFVDYTDPSGIPHKIFVKTVHCGQMPNAATKRVPHSIVQMNRCLHIGGLSWSPTGIQNNKQHPLPFIHTVTVNLADLHCDQDSVVINTAINWTSWQAQATMSYTKVGQTV